MHKLASTPITLKCFEIDDYDKTLMWERDCQGRYDNEMEFFVNHLIDGLESLRQKYLETKDTKYWKELIRWLPESWLQTRTVTMNYENVRSIYSQRRNHKLNEWSGNRKEFTKPSFIKWVESLPWASLLLTDKDTIDTIFDK